MLGPRTRFATLLRKTTAAAICFPICGIGPPEIARALDLSLATVERYWTYARLLFYAELIIANFRCTIPPLKSLARIF
jgi:hypothetical protein